MEAPTCMPPKLNGATNRDLRALNLSGVICFVFLSAFYPICMALRSPSDLQRSMSGEWSVWITSIESTAGFVIEHTILASEVEGVDEQKFIGIDNPGRRRG